MKRSRVQSQNHDWTHDHFIAWEIPVRISTNVLTVSANFLGIQHSIFFKKHQSWPWQHYTGVSSRTKCAKVWQSVIRSIKSKCKTCHSSCQDCYQLYDSLWQILHFPNILTCSTRMHPTHFPDCLSLSKKFQWNLKTIHKSLLWRFLISY